MLEDSREDIGLFQGLDPRRNATEPTSANLMDGRKLLQAKVINFPESGHPVFRGSSASEKRLVKSKGKGVKTIHFNGSDDTIELILRTVNSVNHLCVYGAVADV